MHHELRSPDDARAFLLQGLHLQRLLPVRADSVRPALEWALEIASAGQPLPPVGFVADLGFTALGKDRQSRQGGEDAGLAHGLLRAYEDRNLAPTEEPTAATARSASTMSSAWRCSFSMAS